MFIRTYLWINMMSIEKLLHVFVYVCFYSCMCVIAFTICVCMHCRYMYSVSTCTDFNITKHCEVIWDIMYTMQSCIQGESAPGIATAPPPTSLICIQAYTKLYWKAGFMGKYTKTSFYAWFLSQYLKSLLLVLWKLRDWGLQAFSSAAWYACLTAVID